MLLYRLQENAGVGKDRQSRFYMTQKPDSRCFSSACNCEKMVNCKFTISLSITRTQFLLLPRSTAPPAAYLPSLGCCLCSLQGSVLIKSFTRPCPQPTFFVVSWLSPREASPRKMNCVELMSFCFVCGEGLFCANIHEQRSSPVQREALWSHSEPCETSCGWW